MREADKSYLWWTEAWFRTKPGTTPRTAEYKVCAYIFNKPMYNTNSDLPAFATLCCGII